MVRTHEPGEAAFRAILPEEIEWKPFPAFPPSVRLAVLVGEPSKPGPYVIRVKAPSRFLAGPFAQTRHPRRLLQPIARRRLAAVRTVQSEPALKFGDMGS